MKIQKIISQVRRDFTAIFECENCSYTVEKRGYDDSYYHQKVIPKMVCPKCGHKADESFRPLTTKYPDGVQV